MWTLHTRQQQRGAQLKARPGKKRPGEAPGEATRDRDAQEHDRAGDTALHAGAYPASPIDSRSGDETRSGSDAQVAWDAVIRHERRAHARDAHDLDDRAEGK